jgi:hypothetical protein
VVQPRFVEGKCSYNRAWQREIGDFASPNWGSWPKLFFGQGAHRAELNGHEIGDGLVGRVARAAQREFLHAPDSVQHAPRWSSRRRNGVRAV